MNARLIWIFERLGWATDVRWPKADRLDAKRLDGTREKVEAGTMGR
jgi:stearoyl-CoA desaturase (delta-9 desaturase)